MLCGNHSNTVASSQKTIDYITDQIARAGEIRSRKMFGEYALYCNEKIIGLVCDDTLFLKPTDAGRIYIGVPTEAPPYIGSKPMFMISDELLDDREWLSGLVRVTADALPMHVPKQKKRTASSIHNP